LCYQSPLRQHGEFLNDLERVGKCLPGRQEVKILGENKSYWKVKVTVGIVSRIIETEATKTVDSARNRICFKIRSKNGDLDGDLKAAVTPVEDKTKIELNFDIKATGSFSWVINQIVGRQSDKMAEQFASLRPGNHLAFRFHRLSDSFVVLTERWNRVG
jgi:carbon monoxide dehydrogenase subunit G